MLPSTAGGTTVASTAPSCSGKLSWSLHHFFFHSYKTVPVRPLSFTRAPIAPPCFSPDCNGLEVSVKISTIPHSPCAAADVDHAVADHPGRGLCRSHNRPGKSESHSVHLSLNPLRTETCSTRFQVSKCLQVYELTSRQPADNLNKRQAQPFTGPAPGPLATSPPSYPSPWGTGAGNWSDAYTKARAFVSQLTLLEKVNLTTGVS